MSLLYICVTTCKSTVLNLHLQRTNKIFFKKMNQRITKSFFSLDPDWIHCFYFYREWYIQISRWSENGRNGTKCWWKIQPHYSSIFRICDCNFISNSKNRGGRDIAYDFQFHGWGLQ